MVVGYPGDRAERILNRHNEFRRALVEAIAQNVWYEMEWRRHRRELGWVVPWSDVPVDMQERCRAEAQARVSKTLGDRLW